MENKWIATKDQLPKHDEWVLVSWENESHMMILSYSLNSDGRGFWSTEEARINSRHPTHWMPLPPLPSINN